MPSAKFVVQVAVISMLTAFVTARYLPNLSAR